MCELHSVRKMHLALCCLNKTVAILQTTFPNIWFNESHHILNQILLTFVPNKGTIDNKLALVLDMVGA